MFGSCIFAQLYGESPEGLSYIPNNSETPTYLYTRVPPCETRHA